MNKEDLIAMGLTEEQAAKVMDSLDGNFVTKTRFNEINEENKTLKQSISERDTQLEELKKSSGDNAELKQQIEALQQQNAEQQKAHIAEMNRLKLDNVIDSALTAAGAKNIKAVRALLDPESLKLGNDGNLTGLDEQLKAVRKSDSYLFSEKDSEVKPQFKGFQPGASGDVNPKITIDPSKMTYSEMTAYLAANPDTKIE